MSEPWVSVSIDGVEVSVPKGTLIVDAAKKAGIDIPVFCYHPKMKPVGMCRMCLVEVGRPMRDRASGALVLDDQGKPVLQWGAKLETACSTPVDDGWAVRVESPAAKQGRREIVEFLLTSHPLDCPVCDKGGECPLQNQTMSQGPGVSRFIFDDKMHLTKKLPLGDLIFLDRERCIQCARCIRFQEEIVDDPVIEFFQRGRQLEIVTFSDPGFDSYFSGNTTDICPVGALTTADFRFGARPWEMNAAASICPHCPVGCNLTLNTRREARSNGAEVVKRIMPRQNEGVNELWICDKGRFAHHFASSPGRIVRPMVRKNGQLVETGWEEALTRAAEGLRLAAGGLVGLAGGRASNEDLFNLRMLAERLGGQAVLHTELAGGDLVSQVGASKGTNLAHLAHGDAIVVIACDLREEAPVWWLRVKQAVERGAMLIVANARPTRLDKHAKHMLQYAYGRAVHTALGLLQVAGAQVEAAGLSVDPTFMQAGKSVAAARNLIVFYGNEGLDFEGSAQLAQACAGLLVSTGHAGRADSGLIPVWPSGNLQGAWDMGFRPDRPAVETAKALYVMAADPFGDDPTLAVELRSRGAFVVVQELTQTATTRHADVVFPAQSFIERQGSYTTGERRVQRFYPAVAAQGQARPDWLIAAQVGEKLGIKLESGSPAAVMDRIAGSIPDYGGITYQALAEVEAQWPPVGGDDLYLGGTAYRNEQGLGAQLPSAAERGEKIELDWPSPAERVPGDGLLLVPVTRLFDRGATVLPSALLAGHLARAAVEIHPDEAGRLDLLPEGLLELRWDGHTEQLPVRLSTDVPPGVLLLPRSVGLPLHAPVRVQVSLVTQRVPS
jgi:NADH-quinone oxidoreductase subunit G